jgi:hypothetical protein
MKTRVIWAFLLTAFLTGSSLPTFAQEMSKQDYLDKSRRQKTTGLILMGGGSVLAIAGGVLFSENFCTVGCTPELEQGMNTGTVLMVVGGLTALGSIPLFISSNNSKKAAQISIRNEPTNIPKYAGNIPKSVPSITYTIPLNRN